MHKKLTNLSDEELMELIINGKHSAFAELVSRYTDKFYSTAYRILMSKDDSEDMVQDAFLKLWSDPGKWDKKYNVKFTTWFYKILINQCLDHKRKKKYRTHNELDEKISGNSSTEIAIEKLSMSDLINRSINKLPEKQQLAINLCYYEHLTTREAAEIMGLKPKGVQSLVLRARERLKNILGSYYEKEAI